MYLHIDKSIVIVVFYIKSSVTGIKYLANLRNICKLVILGGNKMKRVGLLFVIMFVLSVAVYAQAITITLSDATSGRLVSGEAGVDTPIRFNSTVALRNRDWLLDGTYRGQVTTMATRGHNAIIIFGGPNSIGKERGIFIHVGGLSDSDGCPVIAQLVTMNTLFNSLRDIYGLDDREFNVRVIDNRPSSVQRTPTTSANENTVQTLNFTGTWEGVDNNYSWVFSGSNYTLKRNNSDVERGTFSVNANQTKFYQNMTHYMENGRWVAYASTLVSDLTILSNSRFRMTGNNGEPYDETYERR